jgi:hypothetical protein
MLQNAYFLAKIGADTAENEQHFAENLPIGRRVADRCPDVRGAMSAAKEVAHSFRYIRAFAKFKQAPKTVAPLAQYTNLTLQSVWDKYDCQTQLLCREALVPLMQRSPEVLDADMVNFGAKKFSF